MYKQCKNTPTNYLSRMQNFSANYFHFKVTCADWRRLPILYHITIDATFPDYPINRCSETNIFFTSVADDICF